jgi:hypothetical protein
MKTPILIGGSAVALAATLATAASAQSDAGSVEATASVSPSKAGTARKPTKATVKFSLKNHVSNATTPSWPPMVR